MKKSLILFCLLFIFAGVVNRAFADFSGPSFFENSDPKGSQSSLGNPETFESLADGDETPPPFPEEDPNPVPLDGGASLLLLAGAGIAVRSLRRKEKK